MRIIALVFLVLSFNVSARTIPQIKKLNGHKVVFQSTEVRYVSSAEMYKARLVVKWGESVFQVADAYFKCGETRCRFFEAKTRAFYEKCRPSGVKFSCQTRLRATSSTPEYDYDRSGYWERHADDGEHHRDHSNWEGSDFPERGDNDWETGGIVLF